MEAAALPTAEWPHEEVVKMHERYMDGATLRELGEENGITYERIRQIFRKHDLPTRKAKRQSVARQSQKLAAQDRRDEIFKAYKRLGTVEAVVEELGLPRQFVAPILSEMELRQLYRRKGRAVHTDVNFILDCLKRAAEICGEPLTIPAYRSIAPENGFVADLTVVNAFGSWQNACEAAGVRANPAEGPRKGAYTVEDCLNSLRQCADELGRIPSYETYSGWAKGKKRPSGPTIRVKVRSWRNALLLAFDED